MKLRYYRELNHLSQSKLASELNISLRNYQRIESGFSSPSLNTVYDLCMILKVDFNDFIKSKPPVNLQNNVIFYNEEDGHQFENLSEVKDSSILALLNDPTLLNFLKDNKLADITNIKEFHESRHPMFISDFNKTLLNTKASKKLGKRSLTLKTSNSTNNIKGLINIWDNLIFHKYKYVKVESETMDTYKCYFRINNSDYIMGFYNN